MSKTAIITGLAILAFVIVGVIAVPALLDVASEGDPPTARELLETTAGGTPDESAGPSLEGSAASMKSPTAAAASPKADSPAAPQTWPVQGRVLDAEGRGIAGARVAAWAEHGYQVEVEVASAISADDGSFALDVAMLAGLSRIQRASAQLSVRAHADRFMPGESKDIELAEAVPGETLRVDMLLEVGSIVQGRVLVGPGRPAEAHDVTLVRSPTWARVTSRATDAEGRYRIGVQAPGTYRVLVTGSEGVGRSEDLAVEGRQEVVVPDLMLGRGKTIRGHVVFEDGSPVPETPVFAQAVGTPSPDGTPAGLRHQPRVITAADGSFTLVAHREGPFEVMLGDHFGGRIKAACRAGDEGVRLVVKGSRLVIRVVGPDDMPLVGAGISLIGWSATNASLLDQVMAGTIAVDAARADADAFMGAILGAPTGELSALVPPGSAWYASASVSGAHPAEAGVHIDPEKRTTYVKLVVRDPVLAAKLTLTLTDSQGAPIPKYHVEIQTLTGTTIVSAAADEAGKPIAAPVGRFRLRAVPVVGDSFLERTFMVSSFLLPVEQVIDVKPGQGNRLTLKPNPGGRLRLRLEFPGGVTPEDVDLRVSARPRDDAEAPIIYAALWISGEGESLVVSSNYTTGAPRLNAKLLVPDDYEFEFHSRVYGTYKRTVRIRPGEITDLILELRKP